ncbi:MAG: hypothetical protein ACI4PG_11545 [Candidatus Ventricola sp.]
MKRALFLTAAVLLCLAAGTCLAEWTNSQGDTIWGISTSSQTDFWFVQRKTSSLDSQTDSPAGTTREWLYLLKIDNTLVEMWSISTYKDTMQPVRMQYYSYNDQGQLVYVTEYYYSSQDQQGTGICYIYDDETGNDYFALTNDGKEAIIARYEDGEYVQGSYLDNDELLAQYGLGFRALSFARTDSGWALWLDDQCIQFDVTLGKSYRLLDGDWEYRYNVGDDHFTVVHEGKTYWFYPNGDVREPSGSQSAATPTPRPTATPTAKPTARPTAKPTATPTAKPTATPTPAPSAITGSVVSKLAGNAGPGTGSSFGQMGTWDLKGQQVRVISKAPLDNEKWWLQVEFGTGEGLIRCYTGSQRLDCTASALSGVPNEAILYAATLAFDYQPRMGPGTEYALQYVSYDNHSALHLRAGAYVTVYAEENGYAQIEYTYRDGKNGVLRYRSWVPLWSLE